jgi:hypothetical protein
MESESASFGNNLVDGRPIGKGRLSPSNGFDVSSPCGQRSNWGMTAICQSRSVIPSLLSLVLIRNAWGQTFGAEEVSIRGVFGKETRRKVRKRERWWNGLLHRS